MAGVAVGRDCRLTYTSRRLSRLGECRFRLARRWSSTTRRSGSLRKACIRAYEFRALAVVVGRQQFGHRYVAESWVAVPRLAIGKRELACFDDRVHPVGRQMLGACETGVSQERELLQENGTLRPRAGLAHRVLAVVERDRAFDRRPPCGHVVCGEQPAVSAT